MSEQNTRQTLETYRDNIRNRITARLSRPSLAENLQEQNKQQAEKKSPMFAEMGKDKPIYVFMGVSAIFTAILGLILGLAPYSSTGANGAPVITFNTDFLHVTIAVVNVIAFVTVTEVAFLIAKNKFHQREEGNPAQHWTMIIMMALAFVSVIGTGYAGGVIGASVLGFLTEFREIPPSAQRWVVAVVPVLIAVYAVLLTTYKLTSEEERDKRLADQMERKQKREHALYRTLADLEAQEMMALAEDKAYIDAVERGVLSAGEASAARKAGKALKTLEKEKGQDLDGDGKVGHGDSVPVAALTKGQNGTNP